MIRVATSTASISGRSIIGRKSARQRIRYKPRAIPALGIKPRPDAAPVLCRRWRYPSIHRLAVDVTDGDHLHSSVSEEIDISPVPWLPVPIKAIQPDWKEPLFHYGPNTVEGIMVGNATAAPPSVRADFKTSTCCLHTIIVPHRDNNATRGSISIEKSSFCAQER